MYQYSNNDILQRTGLKPDFINHCNSKLGDLLRPFRIKGDKNKLLYDDSGLRLWDAIKQHKERGENIRQIREVLERIVRPDSQTTESTSKPTSQTFQTNPQTSQGTAGERVAGQTQAFIDAFLQIERDHRKEIDERHEEVRAALRGHIQALKDQMLLLTDGRTPEEVRHELKQAVRDRAELARLQEAREKEQGRRDHREALIAELEQLTGWGKAKRRREILTKLKKLEAK